MAEAISFYVVDESLFPDPESVDPHDPDLPSHVRQIIFQRGARWETFEIRLGALHEALEYIDDFLGGTGALPAYGMQSSPKQLLSEGDAEMGFFPAEVARDTHGFLTTLGEAMEASDEVAAPFREQRPLKVVYNALLDATAEAKSRGYGVAIVW